MTFDDLLKPHLPGLPAILPAEIRQATILVRHSPDAVSRGIPTRVAEAVEERLRDALPLLRAGYAAVAPGSGRELLLNVLPSQDGYAIEIADAAHTPLLAQILFRLLIAENQTPPDAWQRLLAALDGDEAAAKDAFAPLDFVNDVATLRFEAQGVGQQDFTLTPAVLRSELAGIVEQLSAKGERQAFLLPAAAVLDEDQENGFLSLQNARIFSRDLDRRAGDEPEIFLEGDAASSILVAEGWTEDPIWLAELLWTLARGEIAPVRRAD